MRIPITPYGLRELAVAGALFVVGLVAGIILPLYPLIPAVSLVLGFTAYFFRDPERQPPAGGNLLLAAADGTLTDIQTVDEPEFIGGPATRIGVFMSLFSVHVNRAPHAGRVAFVRRISGKFHNAMDVGRASAENECNLIGLELADGRKLLVRQVAGVVARRIVCSVRVGDALAAGQRIGMVKFGSRMEVYVPADVDLDIRVKPGDAVWAGLSVLGELR